MENRAQTRKSFVYAALKIPRNTIQYKKMISRIILIKNIGT
jgi:hypothetical protein